MAKERIVEIMETGQQYAYTSLQMHETIASRAGFAGTDHKYLGFFLQKGALTAGELAALSGLSTGAVTGLIDRFEKKELVKRQSDKDDRRKVIIVPDKKRIMALLEPLYLEYRNETDKIIASFSEAEQEVIRTYLSRSVELMRTIKDKIDQ